MAKLLSCDYEIIYRLGHENSVVDALSHVPRSHILNGLFIPQVELWEDMKKSSKDHPYMEHIHYQA